MIFTMPKRFAGFKVTNTVVTVEKYKYTTVVRIRISCKRPLFVSTDVFSHKLRAVCDQFDQAYVLRWQDPSYRTRGVAFTYILEEARHATT